MSASEYVTDLMIRDVLSGMTPENQLVMELCRETGLRVDDALNLTTANLKGGKVYYVAEKTGKAGVAPVSAGLVNRILKAQKNAISKEATVQWLFPGRDGIHHRTRQAVWKNCRDARQYIQLSRHMTPHSMRKAFAVDLNRRKGFKATKEALQHSDDNTTRLYTDSDLEAGTEFDFDRACDDLFERLTVRLTAYFQTSITLPCGRTLLPSGSEPERCCCCFDERPSHGEDAEGSSSLTRFTYSAIIKPDGERHKGAASRSSPSRQTRSAEREPRQGSRRSPKSQR